MSPADNLQHLQVNTFEAVRANAFSLLADLVGTFDGEQLSLLFDKFEACSDRSAAENALIMQLVRRLAENAKVTLLC